MLPSTMNYFLSGLEKKHVFSLQYIANHLEDAMPPIFLSISSDDSLYEKLVDYELTFAIIKSFVSSFTFLARKCLHLLIYYARMLCTDEIC